MNDVLRCADCGAAISLDRQHTCPEPHTPFTGNADPEFPDHAVPKE